MFRSCVFITVLASSSVRVDRATSLKPGVPGVVGTLSSSSLDCNIKQCQDLIKMGLSTLLRLLSFDLLTNENIELIKFVV